MDTTPSDTPEVLELKARVLELDKQLAEQMKDVRDDLGMIRVQALINKRNEAFAQMSEMLRKFQKEMDGIVGNMH